MVTRSEVKNLRNFLNKSTSNKDVKIPSDILNTIDSMCADYEFKYDLSW
jgi:hypothetical protein